MNKQKPGIEWTHVFGPGTGRTWNPVGGCKHGCRWDMPDGTVAVCYAETTAERVAQAAYPEGFAHHYWRPDKLDEPARVKESCGIFLDSMSDLFGAWVPDEQIRAVLDVVNDCPQHVFMSLTKNAPRLRKFDYLFPDNLWVGVSMPPSIMFGKPLSRKQQERMYLTSLSVLDDLRGNGTTTWVSYEPLAWDVTDIDDAYFENYLPIDWAVIGAASAGREHFQPERPHVLKLLSLCADNDVSVFFKGNLDWEYRRLEFPTHKIVNTRS